MKLSKCAILRIEKQIEDQYNSLSKLSVKPSSDISQLNWEILMTDATKQPFSKISKEDNIYLFFDADFDNKLLYVGKSNSIHDRLRSHLICTSEKTKSKLEKVKELILREHHTLQIATFKVEPDYYYQMVESYLIRAKKPLWNNRND